MSAWILLTDIVNDMGIAACNPQTCIYEIRKQLMRKQFLEAGRIINTHGVRGGVKIEPWTDSPSDLCSIKTIFIDEKPVKVLSSSTHNGFVIAYFEGYTSLDDAIRLKNKTVFINRNDICLEEGAFFLQDLIGLTALDYESGEQLGTLTDILELPAGNVYLIKGDREILVPANGGFMKDLDIDSGWIKFTLIEGM